MPTGGQSHAETGVGATNGKKAGLRHERGAALRVQLVRVNVPGREGADLGFLAVSRTQEPLGLRAQTECACVCVCVCVCVVFVVCMCMVVYNQWEAQWLTLYMISITNTTL